MRIKFVFQKETQGGRDDEGQGRRHDDEGLGRACRHEGSGRSEGYSVGAQAGKESLE
jgi:hypothetical protein